MKRKIMIEVTEEELKKLEELDREKTLDECVDVLLRYLRTNKPDRTFVLIEPITDRPLSGHYYESQRFCVTVTRDNMKNVEIKIHIKKNDASVQENEAQKDNN